MSIIPQLDKKYRVNCGEFIHPIEIQRLVSTEVDENGIMVEVWETLFQTRAKAYTSTNKEYLDNNITEYERVNKKFVFRTIRNKKVNAKDRVLYDGEIYNVSSAYDYDDKGILTLLITYKVE